jgi:WhiB family transcriptional regulator, redox-sensing transcriptional regulator
MAYSTRTERTERTERNERAEESKSFFDDAACRGADTSIFFPVSDSQAGAAKAICAECPVQDACLEHALETHQPDGIWGGLTPIERHRLVRRRQKAAREARSRSSAA